MDTKKLFILCLVIAGSVIGILTTNDNSQAGGFIPSLIGAVEDTQHAGYRVVKVIDGDTIDVEIEGKKEAIRFLGINTPESVDPRRPVQCFGREASKKMKDLLKGEYVLLERDPDKEDRDKYGRLLRYVYRESDNLLLNQYMIKEGYAYEYTYEGTYKFKDQWKQLQKEAEAAGRGLWNKDTCAGKK